MDFSPLQTWKKNGMTRTAKLDWEKARWIREIPVDLQNADMARTVAHAWDMSPNHVRKIWRGDSWRAEDDPTVAKG